MSNGWAAQCNYHFKCGFDQRRCQKSCKDSRFSSDEQRRLCKAWLLAGLAVAEDDPEGQPEHVFDYDLYTVLYDTLPEEADLDSQAAALEDS